MSKLTIEEMHQSIRLGVQQVDANYVDGFMPEELDVYINKAIHRYVKSQYSILKQDSDLQQEYAVENLRSLVVHAQFTSFQDSDRIPQAKMVTLPDQDSPSPGQEITDYEYFVHAFVSYDDDLGDEDSPSPGEDDDILKTCELISYWSVGQYLPTQTNEVPWFEKVPILLYEGNVHILRERKDDVLRKFDFVYLRSPRKVDHPNSVDCDLPDHTHQDLVDATVSLIIRDVTQRGGAGEQPQPNQPETE